MGGERCGEAKKGEASVTGKESRREEKGLCSFKKSLGKVPN